MEHLPAQLEGAAEVARGAFRVAILQQPPDMCGGDLRAIIQHRRHDGEPDAAPLRFPRQEGRVAAAPMAEGEVGPAGQVPRAEALVQHLLHEGVGGHGGESRVEGQRIEDRCAKLAQRLCLRRQQREAERRIVGPEVLARMRLEGQRGQGQVGPRAMCRTDHRGMAQMHAVEIAERDGRAAQRRGHAAPLTQDSGHDGRPHL